MIALIFGLKIRIAVVDYQNVLRQTHVVNDFIFRSTQPDAFQYTCHMSNKSNLKGCGAS